MHGIFTSKWIWIIISGDFKYFTECLYDGNGGNGDQYNEPVSSSDTVFCHHHYFVYFIACLIDPDINRKHIGMIIKFFHKHKKKFICIMYYQVTPGNQGTYCLWSISAASAAAVLPTLFNFPGKPLKLISSNHTWLTYGCGKIFLHPSRWPWVKVTKLPKRDAIYLVPNKIKWEPLIQSLQNLVGIPPLSCW